METRRIRLVKKLLFLFEVFKLSLTAFGGPQIHFVQFRRRLVEKKRYLTSVELDEFNSLCSMLPGPTSTQTITTIGFRIGGPTLAFLTLLIWSLPACLLMGGLAIVMTSIAPGNPKFDFLKFLPAMGSGFMFYAAYRFNQFFVTKGYHWALMLGTAALFIIVQSPFLIPLMLLVGGLISSYINTRDRVKKPDPIHNIRWDNLLLFLGILVTAATLGALTHHRLILLFENFYRYGSIVFGGGSVLIPMMLNQFVEYKHYMEASSFLAGVGFIQAMPGPVFAIASFVGAMSMQDGGVFGQMMGMLVGSTGIFLPGILLIFFVYPIWDQLKNYAPVKNALEGINAASAGLVLSSAFLLFVPVEINEQNMLVLLSTLLLLLSTKVPSPLIVLACLLAGYLL